MTIDFEDESGRKLGTELYETAERVIAFTLDYVDCPYEACVGLLITDDAEIHRMNREHRGIDRPTDVLSFPMTEYGTPGDFSFLEEADDCFEPDSGELLLGDIVISADQVLRQAQEYGHSVLREYAFLITHSMLHLIGYDHETPEQAEQMERMQAEILNALGITR